MTTRLDVPALPAHDLDDKEVDSLLAVLSPTGASQPDPCHPSTVRKLPERLLAFLDEMRLTEPSGGFLVRGFPVDDEAIGPTPPHWREAQQRTATAVHERYLLALGNALGDIFAFRALQEGRLVQDLMPIAGQEKEKNGNSSSSLLDLHTEDAFHPYRCDYLGLLCLRNVDAVPTSLVELDPSALSAEALDVLFQARFTIRPDTTHGEPTDLRPEAVLWGDRRRPYLRFDDYFTDSLPGDTQAWAAFEELLRVLTAAERGVVLQPGELLFVNNHLAAHGRRPFRARYDGTDRWLKRVSVTHDLRRSRALRETPQSRVLG